MSTFAPRLRYLLSLISFAFLALVMAFSLIGASTSAVAAKPPTATPAGPTATPSPSGAFYVDCSAASNGTGTQTSPWNNLTTVNAQTFSPGSSLFFKRATTCAGSFVFSSSGTSASPITIDAYGTGALPIIDGTGQNRAVKLLDTSYVTMQNLEVTNSLVWGILLTTDHDAPATNITLRNLTVHHVTGGDYTAMRPSGPAWWCLRRA